MKSMFARHLAFGVCILLCGCHRQEVEDPAVAAVRVKFRHIQEGLRTGNSVASNAFSLDQHICEWIACVSNTSQRVALVTELSEMILAVDLKKIPYLSDGESGGRYLQREFASYLYLDYVKALLRVMRRCGGRSKDAMEFYFRAMQKFKDAWLSIPYESKKLPGESLEQYSARCGVAWKTQGLYEQEMSEIRHIVLPRLSSYLPPELHGEFKQRIKPFFDFPRKEEYYEMMHPGEKYPYSTIKSSDSKTSVTNNPEEDIEVDI